MTLAWEPTGQLVQADAAAMEKVPRAQLRQDDDEAAPVLVE